jgi:hypothetical protein
MVLGDCRRPVCNSGVCGELKYTGDGPELMKFERTGDCRKATCVDGRPTLVEEIMDAPTPATVCVTFACEGSKIVASYKPTGTTCQTAVEPTGACVEGQCVDCIPPPQPGQEPIGCQNLNGTPICTPEFQCSDLNHCNNNLPDQGETGKDCGGACPPCATSSDCLAPADCNSQVCTNNICQAPTCMDGQKNGGETDIDCGGASSPCKGCEAGRFCVQSTDCLSGNCLGDVCQPPSCADGVQNGLEEQKDCGGPFCDPCAP